MTKPMLEEVTIRKSVNDKTVEKIPRLISEALVFMRAKYPDVNFDNVKYIFSNGYNRSRYFRNENNTTYPYPNVCICTRARLLLYNKRSLKMKLTELFVGAEIQIVCALIHELTHHVQYERGERQGNELDTTRNELEYLEQRHEKYYNKIMGN